MSKNLYEVLEVDKQADKETIKKAYRKKARKKHPDAGGTNEEFNQLNLAYRVLSDDTKRKEYDETGECKEISEEHRKQSAVIQLIYETFKEVLKEVVQRNLEPDSFSLVGNITKLIKAMRQEDSTKKQLLIKAQKNFQEILKRLKTKNDRTVIAMLNDELANIAKHLVKKDEELEIEDEALKILEDYDYDWDKNKQKHPSTMTMRYIPLFGAGSGWDMEENDE